jgi:hypothetical protein
MANLQRCATGTEAANDALNDVVSKAMALPAAGTHIGGGRHVDMPQTWDGQGTPPPGWTKRATANYVINASTAALPLEDSLVTLLQGGQAQSRLTGPEIATLAQAIGGRVVVDLDAGGYVPKASLVAKILAAAEEGRART